MTDVEIWDPNSVNPYGEELAFLLAEVSISCRLWKPGTSTRDQFDVRASMATNRSIDGLAKHVMLRIGRPLDVMLRASASRRTLLVVWPRGTYECLVFTLASIFTRVIFIDHNPRPERQPGRAAARAQRLLRVRSALVVIHSETFRAWMGDAIDASKVRVARHPLFTAWHGRYRSGSMATTRDDDRTRVLFFGALRPDKGSEELEHLASRLPPEDFVLQVTGHGRVPPGLDLLSRELSNLFLDVRTEPVPDAHLGRALEASDVLIAPYVNATASGTLLLARVFGLPSIAYESGALADVLSARAHVPAGDRDAMIEALVQWRQERFETYLESTSAYQRAAGAEWLEVVQEAGRW